MDVTRWCSIWWLPVTRHLYYTVNLVLVELYYVTFALWHEPSVTNRDPSWARVQIMWFQVSVVCDVVAPYPEG